VVDPTSGVPLAGYLEEILHAEGLRGVQTLTLPDLTAARLADVGVVLLGPCNPTAQQVAALETFVRAGGGLIAMRPDAELAALCGLQLGAGSTTDGYLAISDSFVATGLLRDTLRLHGTARHYTPTDAAEIARLYADRTHSTRYPAVTERVLGAGRAIAFAFDLGTSIVLMRQGDPSLADVDADGDGAFRSVDLFDGWTDVERNHIPQADMLQRLLVRMLDSAAPVPLPRIWHFPDDSPAVLVCTGDAHANPDAYYQALVDALHARGVPLTFFLSSSAPAAPTINDWLARGFDVGPHPYINGGFAASVAQDLRTFSTTYGVAAATTRTHQVRWSGWVAAAQALAEQGVGMDFSGAYEWAPRLSLSNGDSIGYLNGSGLPMRYMAADGSFISLFQQHTVLVDEQIAPEIGLSKFTLDEAIAVSRRVIDDAVTRFHTVLATQFHVDYFGWNGVHDWVLATVEHALRCGALPLTARAWLTFTQQRRATTVDILNWADDTLTLRVNAGGPSQSLRLPTWYRGGKLSAVSLNGIPITYRWMTVNGRSYATLPAASGVYAVTYQSAATRLSLLLHGRSKN
jgi:hypothetical protein